MPTFGKRFFSNSKFINSSFLLKNDLKKNKKVKKLINSDQNDIEYAFFFIYIFCKKKIYYRNALISETEFYNIKQPNEKTFYDIFCKIRANYPDLTLQEIEEILKKQMLKKMPRSRAYYRIQVINF